MIYLKRPDQIKAISEAGVISKRILLEAISMVKPGISSMEINNLIESRIKESNCTPWFKEVGNYKYASCIAVNEGWIHGIPNNDLLKIGDIVSIDIGVKKDGYYVDHCWTVPVYKDSRSYTEFPLTFELDETGVAEFLNNGVKALLEAISSIESGKRIGIISNTMEKVVRSAGYSLVKEYAGHGVGISSHEDPLIPCYGSINSGPAIKNGMVLAVEVMYAMGKSDIKTAKDGWTVSTADGKLSGMFEHTVAVINGHPEILTN